MEDNNQFISEDAETNKVENIDKILEMVSNIQEKDEIITKIVKQQIEIKDQQISDLYKELEFYKQNYADKFTDQLMKAVIKVRKDMNRQILSPEWENMSADDLRREYQYCLEDITDLLEQQNVDPYYSEPGDYFNPAIHQAKVEITDDAICDKKIKESISEGYRKGDKILIPEKVIVYQYKA